MRRGRVGHGETADIAYDRMKTSFLILAAIVSFTACRTTGHVGNWERVGVAMPRDRVHALLGKPAAVLGREEWDEMVRKAVGSLRTEAALILSRSCLSQFEAVEIWRNPAGGGDLAVYFSKKGTVLGRLPYHARIGAEMRSD